MGPKILEYDEIIKPLFEVDSIFQTNQSDIIFDCVTVAAFESLAHKDGCEYGYRVASCLHLKYEEESVIFIN